MRPQPTIREAPGRGLTWVIGLLFLLLFGLTIHSHANSWNDLSRLATVEALVHHKTWAIENTALGSLTGDRIYLVADATGAADAMGNGHFYSDKPPVLSLLTAGVYTVLHKALGISLLPQTCDPEMSACYCFALLCPSPPDWAYYLLTLIMVSAPSALMLALFYRSLITKASLLASPPLRWPPIQRSALILTLILGLGTLILPYSLVFNNHVPAAACLMVGFYAWLHARFPKDHAHLDEVAQDGPFDAVQGKLFVAGFAFALAFTFDLWTGPFLGLFGIHALWRFRRRARHRAWPFLIGALLPVALLAGLDWHILGDPLPPQLHPEGFNYPGSPFPSTVTGTQSAPHIPSYAFRMLVGDHGWLAFTPIMGWAIFALGQCLRQRKHPLWSEALTVSVGSFVTVLYFALFTNNFGGTSYGPRWVIAMTPLLFFFVQVNSKSPGGRPHARSLPWKYLVFTGLSLLSFVSAWRGTLDPWTYALPLLRLETATSPIARYIQRDPTLSNAVIYVTPPEDIRHSGWRANHWADPDLAGLPKRVRAFDAASGLLPAGDPDRPLLYVIREGAPSGATDTTLTRWETAFPQGTWGFLIDGKGIYRVPAGKNRVALPSAKKTENALTVEFDEKIRLIAYGLAYDAQPGSPTPATLRAGDPIKVHLAWQVMAPIEESYTAFVHLMNETELWAQDDHQPGYTTHPTYPTDRWFPGEIILDVFQLTVPPEAPPGTYQLSTGFYTLATLQRLPRSDTQGDTATLTHIRVAD